MKYIVITAIFLSLFFCTQVNDAPRAVPSYQKFYYNESVQGKDSAYFLGSDTIVIVEQDTFHLKSRDTLIYQVGIGQEVPTTVYDTVVQFFIAGTIEYAYVRGGDTLYPDTYFPQSSSSSLTDSLLSSSGPDLSSSSSAESSSDEAPDLELVLISDTLFTMPLENGATYSIRIRLQNRLGERFSVDLKNIIVRIREGYLRIKSVDQDSIVYGDPLISGPGGTTESVIIGNNDSVTVTMLYPIAANQSVMTIAYAATACANVCAEDYYEKSYFAVLNDSLYQNYRDSVAQ